MKTELFFVEKRQTEQALAESERRYRRLLAATTDYIYSVTVDNGRSGATTHGAGCEAVTGYTSQEFADDPYLWYRIVYDEDRPAVLRQADLILKGELPPPLEHRILHKHKGVRWIRNTAIPHTDRQGRLIGYDGLISDITKRKRAEQLISAEFTVTLTLAEAHSLSEALPQVLENLCRALLWDYAAYWSCDAGTLRRQAAFWRPPLRAEDLETADCPRTLLPGAGLPGRVSANAEPVWIPNVAADVELARTLPSSKAGLRCGCAIGVRVGGELAGVVELYSREARQPDRQMLDVLSALAVQSAQFIERKRFEDKLREERNLLRTLVDNLPDCIFVKDTASRFLLSNAAHLRMLGVAKPEEALGKTDHDFFPEELAARYRADETDLMRTGRPLVNREEPAVDSADHQRWFLSTKVPLINGDGKAIGLVGIARDITERRLAQQALRESEARLALVIQGSNDGVWDWNLLTNETYFSPRWKQMLGYADKEVENSFAAWEHLMHPDDLPHARAQLRAYFSGEIPTYEMEHRLRHRDGTYRWILARGVLLRDAQGKPVRMAGSHMDLTERKQTAERLQQTCVKLARRDEILKQVVRKLHASHRELKQTQLQLIQAAKLESVGTLAAGVAHEVKNPLQIIIIGLDYLVHYLAHNLPVPNEDLTVTLADMRQAVNRANAIIRELLNLSAATVFQTAPGDLNALVQQSLHLTHTEFVGAKIKVNLELAPDLPAVLMDQAKMGQVMINILINAVQAMPKGGTLTVRNRWQRVKGSPLTREPVLRRFNEGETVIVLEIQDTGPGIPAAILPRIFDPFFTSKPVGVGTGLGLTVARNIVDLHGGAIEIKNAPVGGALVTMVLKT